MMILNENDLPNWVKYVAEDSNGEIFGYDSEPVLDEKFGCWINSNPNGECILIKTSNDWVNSLRKIK